MKQGTKKALIWILAPILSFVLIFALYPILNTIFYNPEGLTKAMQITNGVLSALSFLALLTIPVGVVMGIINLKKK